LEAIAVDGAGAAAGAGAGAVEVDLSPIEESRFCADLDESALVWLPPPAFETVAEDEAEAGAGAVEVELTPSAGAGAAPVWFRGEERGALAGAEAAFGAIEFENRD
jgi:hypothetical protein